MNFYERRTVHVRIERDGEFAGWAKYEEFGRQWRLKESSSGFYRMSGLRDTYTKEEMNSLMRLTKDDT